MPQYVVKFKDGENVPVMAQNVDEAKTKARKVRQFRGEKSSGIESTSGPNDGFMKHPDAPKPHPLFKRSK